MKGGMDDPIENERSTVTNDEAMYCNNLFVNDTIDTMLNVIKNVLLSKKFGRFESEIAMITCLHCVRVESRELPFSQWLLNHSLSNDYSSLSSSSSSSQLLNWEHFRE